MVPFFLIRLTMKDMRKISEMRNLGPACEQDFNAVGVKYAHQIIKLGAKKAFIEMLKGRLELGRSAKCCNALYLYSLHGAIHDQDWRELSEDLKSDFRQLTKELRNSGLFD